MKITTSLLLAVFSVNSLGETNCPLASPQLFSLPSVQLRATTPEPEMVTHPFVADPVDALTLESPPHKPAKALPQLASESVPGESLAAMTLTAEQELMMRYYDRLERGGYLTRPELPSDNRILRMVEPIFQPESIKVGKTIVSCSILTAIKRKNPLALLNPIVLNIAW